MDWEQLYIKYSDSVYNYIFLLVGNKEVSEDLTHDTFVKVKYSLNRFRGESSYYTWIYSVARNVTYDYIRRKKLIQFVPFLKFDVQSSLTSPADIVINKESVQELYFTIKRLKLAYREVIILRYIHELSIEETATILNWSLSKVKSKTFIAMRKLKEELLSEQEVK